MKHLKNLSSKKPYLLLIQNSNFTRHPVFLFGTSGNSISRASINMTSAYLDVLGPVLMCLEYTVSHYLGPHCLKIFILSCQIFLLILHFKK